MKKEDRSTFLIVAVVLIICIASLIVIFSLVWKLIAEPINKSIDYVSENSPITKQTDYNFDIPEEDDIEEEEKKDDDEEEKAEEDMGKSDKQLNYIIDVLVRKVVEKRRSEDLLLDEATEGNIIATSTGRKYYSYNGDYLIPNVNGVYDYTFPVRNYEFPKMEEVVELQSIPDAIISDAKLAGYGSNTSDNAGSSQFGIRIPKIGVDSPVLQGLGANDLLEKGFWVHPNSGELGKGVVTLLCHRRYFGPYDPRSCWFLDKVEQNDDIIVGFEGQDLRYKVVGVNVFEGDDPLIYTFDEEGDYIKIVTCTPLYSNQQRLVILAKRVE